MGPLDPVPLVGRPGRPADTALSRADVIDEETFQPHRVQRGMGIEGVIHGGTGSKQDDVADDTEIFLRHVDAVVRTQVSSRAELPLVLVAAARLAAAFQRLTANPHLLADHAAVDPPLLTTAADLSRRGDAPAIRTPDLFGALAETVLEHRGDIVALARNAMPTESGVAAIYRW